MTDLHPIRLWGGWGYRLQRMKLGSVSISHVTLLQHDPDLDHADNDSRKREDDIDDTKDDGCRESCRGAGRGPVRSMSAHGPREPLESRWLT